MKKIWLFIASLGLVTTAANISNHFYGVGQNILMRSSGYFVDGKSLNGSIDFIDTAYFH